MTPDLRLGAEYVAAVLSGDLAVAAAIRSTTEHDQLVVSLDYYLLVMGRRIAVDSGRTLEQVGEGFIKAAEIQRVIHID